MAEEGGGWPIRRLPPLNSTLNTESRTMVKDSETHPQSHIRQRSRSAGQELVEFALVVPVLILIAFGVLDLGRAFHAAVTVENAARVGARYGTFHPDESAAIITETRNEAQNSGVPLNATNSSVAVVCPDIEGCIPGHPIRVTVTYQFPLVLGFILPSPVNIVGRAEMVVP